ncbi:conserved hypothetical protein [gamma proteobacterium HdN1]|nr:conserved hypothetical protein [gamma proteobacterium HdN1]
MSLIPGSATSASGEARALIEGPAGAIDAIVMQPKEGEAAALAVICHPHPLMGGSMTNKVVHTIARAHRDAGHVAVRFNFRGVGRSQGEFDEGRGEALDLLAVVRWARALYPRGALYIAGFSFGAWVSASAMPLLDAANLGVKRLLLVAPPVHYAGFDPIHRFSCPLTVIMGDADEVVAPVGVFGWFERVETDKKLRKMSEATHFFHGRLQELKEWVEQDMA